VGEEGLKVKELGEVALEVAAKPQYNMEVGRRAAVAVRRGKGGGSEGGLDRGGEGKEEFGKGGVDAR
jgi:hypothetical protein